MIKKKNRQKFSIRSTSWEYSWEARAFKKSRAIHFLPLTSYNSFAEYRKMVRYVLFLPTLGKAIATEPGRWLKPNADMILAVPIPLYTFLLETEQSNREGRKQLLFLRAGWWQSVGISATKARGDDQCQDQHDLPLDMIKVKEEASTHCSTDQWWLLFNGSWAGKKKGKAEGIAARLCWDAWHHKPASWVLWSSGCPVSVVCVQQVRELRFSETNRVCNSPQRNMLLGAATTLLDPSEFLPPLRCCQHIKKTEFQLLPVVHPLPSIFLPETGKTPAASSSSKS